MIPMSRSIADERAGSDMLYSSGTTGRPKGIRPPLPEDPAIDGTNALTMIAQALFRTDPNGTYLSPAPLYHAAPLRWCMSMTKFGMTLVIMEKFDPEQYLALVEKYKITHTTGIFSLIIHNDNSVHIAAIMYKVNHFCRHSCFAMSRGVLLPLFMMRRKGLSISCTALSFLSLAGSACIYHCLF